MPPSKCQRYQTTVHQKFKLQIPVRGHKIITSEWNYELWKDSVWMICQLDSRHLAYMAKCLHPTRLHGDSPTANSPTQPLTKIPHLFLIAVFCKLSYSRNYLKISYVPCNSQNKLRFDNWFWSESNVLILIVPMSLALN